MATRPTGTVTFLFTDIEGSTKNWENNRQAMAVAHARQETIIRQAVAAHDGYCYKMVGDAFQAAFATAAAALAAAVEAQRGLFSEPWPLPSPLRVRMALHTGVTEEREGDYFGPALNRVARLLTVSHGGQTLMTLATEELVRDQLPPSVALRDMGEHHLRDLINTEHVFQVVAEGTAGDFPPLKTIDERPNNLPVRPTPMVGREAEVAACTQLLQRPDVRLVTLTGPGGIGKTRLALHTAATLLDDFPDGVFFVALATITDPVLVAPTIMQALSVRAAPGVPELETLKDYLRALELLLVLDNFEQVAAAAPLIWDLLSAAPQVKALVTTRVALHVMAEHEFPVPPLHLPDVSDASDPACLMQSEAVALFVARAQAVQPAFALSAANGPAIAQICLQLDGLPLAIEMAAARIKILSAQALLARLSSRLQLLTGGGRDLPARQQTMRAAIEWSYDLLAENDEVLFRRMAVFVGDFSLEMVEAICFGMAGLACDLVDAVSSLVDQNMIRQIQAQDGEVHFRMLATIREFALERLAESAEGERIHELHAAYFLRIAETAESFWRGSEQVPWLDRLEADHDNVRAALRWAIDRQDAQTGLRLAGAIWWFWYLRSHVSE